MTSQRNPSQGAVDASMVDETIRDALEQARETLGEYAVVLAEEGRRDGNRRVHSVIDRINRALTVPLAVPGGVGEARQPTYAEWTGRDEPDPEWWPLRQFGYAPGGYIITCRGCDLQNWDCDKRATTCRQCAEKALAADPPANPATSDPFARPLFCRDDEDPVEFGRLVAKASAESDAELAPSPAGGVDVEGLRLAFARVLHPHIFERGLDPLPGDGPATRDRISSTLVKVDALLAALSAQPGAETPPQPEPRWVEIDRLKREIGVRQARLQLLVLGDPTKSVGGSALPPLVDGGR
jgi:hypothetical protein